MNLYTARAPGRAKEVGLRKTLGAERNGMMAQFLFESILYVLLAAMLSVFLIYLILPWFNSLSGKMLTLQIFTEPWFLLTMSVLVVIIGLIACTILVNQQLQFMQNKNLGFNKEQSIVITREFEIIETDLKWVILSQAQD